MALQLSVIVVCINSPDVMQRCLTALAPQKVTGDIEILAIGRWHDRPETSAIRAQHAGVTWLAAPSAATVPQMRLLAMAQSQGDLVALIEDDCVVADDWCREVIRAHQGAFDVIGGPVEPGPEYRAKDWAVFFCEFGRFMAPYTGVVRAVPGTNVSYKRTIVDAVNAEAGFYDVFFHWSLQQAGNKLYSDPSLAVRNINHWSIAHLTRQPFHHGRAFAGMRAEGFPVWRRAVYAVAACGLPVIKLERIARNVFGRRRYRTEFLQSLHWSALFVTCWSLGELLGSLAGSGRSGKQWR
jgi:GT2 family glycosyltransferase